MNAYWKASICPLDRRPYCIGAEMLGQYFFTGNNWRTQSIIGY